MYRFSAFIIVLFTFFTVTEILEAQTNVKTGAKGGLNFANFTGADAEFETRTGFVIGGFAKFDIPDSPFAIQPEAMYSQKGAVDSGNEIRIDYIEIPVLLKYSFAPGSTAQPNLFAGPYAGIRLIAEREGGAGGLFGGSSNLENQTESIDYGGVFGAGIDIEVGTSIFTFDVRYGFGFRNVFREESGRNGVLSVTVGISLPNM